jgi:hypothetical protein
MILMNHLAAKDLLGFGQGIFRSTTTSSNNSGAVASNTTPTEVMPVNTLPAEVLQFINIYRSTSGSYTTSDKVTAHSILGLDAYIHITSPIRRIVDILNMIKFQEIMGFKLSNSALEFYDTWFKDIEHINTSMKLLRRVQNDCNLLHLCHGKPDVLDKVYSGYCFDEKTLENGLYKYNLYLPELKTTSFVICSKLALLEEHQFKLFVFNNEDKMKKKIRLHLV